MPQDDFWNVEAGACSSIGQREGQEVCDYGPPSDFSEYLVGVGFVRDAQRTARFRVLSYLLSYSAACVVV